MIKKGLERVDDVNFDETFLMAVEHEDLFGDALFKIWSPRDSVCYDIRTRCVLEIHYIRIGVGALERAGGLPLFGVYETFGEVREYWAERISAFKDQGLDEGGMLHCIEFDSPLFGNRNRDLLTRNKNVGLLVACREVSLDIDYSYTGPMPEVYTIPGSE